MSGTKSIYQNAFCMRPDKQLRELALMYGKRIDTLIGFG